MTSFSQRNEAEATLCPLSDTASVRSVRLIFSSRDWTRRLLRVFLALKLFNSFSRSLKTPSTSQLPSTFGFGICYIVVQWVIKASASPVHHEIQTHRLFLFSSATHVPISILEHITFSLMFVVQMTKWPRDHPETRLDRQQTFTFFPQRQTNIFRFTELYVVMLSFMQVIDQSFFFHLINLQHTY